MSIALAVVSALLASMVIQLPLVSPSHRAPATSLVYSKAEPIPYAAALPDFVTRSGSQLMLAGRPYRFTGFNIYNANNQGSCWYPLGNVTAMDQTLTSIGPAQMVFRAWFFQPMAMRDSQLDWSAFDATLAAARAHDERVIATLGNQYPDCDRPGGGNRTEAWYRDGYATTPDAGNVLSYRSWVSAVVSRYRNDPTVLAWQLMNEAADPGPSGRCSPTAGVTLKRFAQDISSVIKSIDSNHLISLGTSGVRECGSIGGQYQDVHSVDGIDLCEVHDYTASTERLDPALQLRLNQCRSLNKPLVIGELGLALPDPVARASVLQGKLAASFGAGINGVLVWDWADAGQRRYSGYEIGPGDPALSVLASALRN